MSDMFGNDQNSGGLTPGQLDELATATAAIAADVQTLQTTVGLLPVTHSEHFDVLRAPEVFALETVRANPDFGDPGQPAYVYRLSAVLAPTRHISITLTAPAEDYWEPAYPLHCVLPAGFTGNITVQNSSGSPLILCNPAYLAEQQMMPEPGAASGVSATLPGEALADMVYLDVAGRERLSAFKNVRMLQVLPTSVVVVHPGTLAAGTYAQKMRVGYGKLKLGYVLAEGGAVSDKTLTVTATYWYYNGTSGYTAGAVLKNTVPAGQRNGGPDWTLTSGYANDDASFYTNIGTYLTFTAAYSAAPTTPLTDVRIEAIHEALTGAYLEVLVP